MKKILCNLLLSELLSLQTDKKNRIIKNFVTIIETI